MHFSVHIDFYFNSEKKPSYDDVMACARNYYDEYPVEKVEKTKYKNIRNIF